MNESNDTQAQTITVQEQIHDVVPPPAPEFASIITVGGLMVIIFLLLATNILSRKKKKKFDHRGDVREAAKDQLYQVQNEYINSDIDSRDAAYRIATILRLTYGIRDLDGPPPSPNIDNKQWAALVNLLHQLRYQPEFEVRLSREHFDIIATWLNSDNV